MKLKSTNTRASANWFRRGVLLTFGIILALVTLAVTLGAPAPLTGSSRLHPLLQQLILQHPDARLNVIVRKSVQDDHIEALVKSLGGTVTKDLSLIKAFAATMPASALDELARSNGVFYISPDSRLNESGSPTGDGNQASLLNVYDGAVGADKVWAESDLGNSVTVAVVDSGIANHIDLRQSGTPGAPRGANNSRVIAQSLIAPASGYFHDGFGHGTNVAGIIGGNGDKSNGHYVGIAPQVNLVNVDVANDRGAAMTSDVVAGLQWVYDNRTRYNIRVVNISLNASVPESYHTSPLDAAVEILWFNGIVVVVSAGNNAPGASNGILYPPANDPFAITVGSVDDEGTVNIGDDAVSSFSASGITENGFAKPDLVAPGKNIVSLLAGVNSTFAVDHPDHRVYTFPSSQNFYFRMSGTSASAPIVSGAVALLLQSNPSLNPDQVKYRLKATANKNWNGYSAARAGAGYLDIYSAIAGRTTQTANTGIPASHLLGSGGSPLNWGSVDWNSVDWNSVDWNSVDWNSVDWNSVDWNSVYWGE